MAPPHGKAHSATCVSRKSAFWECHPHEKRSLHRRCDRYVTKRRILNGRRHGKAHFTCGPHQKVHSVCDRSRRVRFSVRVHAQNALFRRMHFSSPAQTWRRLTEKRILQPWCYQKAHSATSPSRCDHMGCAFCEERRHPPEAHSAPVDFSNAQSRSSQPILPLDPERSCPARSPSSGSVSCTATRP